MGRTLIVTHSLVLSTGGTERDLLDQIVHLEKEVRLRDGTISEMRERGAASSGNEARYLREEIEDLKVCLECL